MPQFEAQLGHWIFPVVGIRGAFGTGSERGFITKESYLQNRSTLTADYGNCWGPSTNTLISGNDTIRGALGGYYWPLDNNDNLFVQNWKYIYAGLDLMVNLSYMKKYDRIKIDSSFQHIVYAGFNVRVGISEDNPEKFSNRIGYSHDWHMFKNTNFAAEGHLGYICRYALTPYFAVQGDAERTHVSGSATAAGHRNLRSESICKLDAALFHHLLGHYSSSLQSIGTVAAVRAMRFDGSIT